MSHLSRFAGGHFLYSKQLRMNVLIFSQARLVILSVIIVAQHFPPKFGIMTTAQATVPWIIKAPGGTKIAITQTSMVCTSMVNLTPRECVGKCGKTTMSLSRGLRWKFAQRTSKLQYRILRVKQKQNMYSGENCQGAFALFFFGCCF